MCLAGQGAGTGGEAGSGQHPRPPPPPGPRAPAITTPGHSPSSSPLQPPASEPLSPGLASPGSRGSSWGGAPPAPGPPRASWAVPALPGPWGRAQPSTNCPHALPSGLCQASWHMLVLPLESPSSILPPVNCSKAKATVPCLSPNRAQPPPTTSPQGHPSPFHRPRPQGLGEWRALRAPGVQEAAVLPPGLCLAPVPLARSPRDPFLLLMSPPMLPPPGKPSLTPTNSPSSFPAVAVTVGSGPGSC